MQKLSNIDFLISSKKGEIILVGVAIFFFFWIREKKVYFMGPNKQVKSRLSQALIKNACPNSNSRPTMQISKLLLSRYAPYKWSSKLNNNKIQLNEKQKRRVAKTYGSSF